MYRHRMDQNLGRYGIAGTTIKNPKLLPEHLASDEKHSRLKGRKVYVATTVAEQCMLGASAGEDAGEKGLTRAYGRFKEEALDLNPDCRPKSVNTDGWAVTMKAWKCLLADIFVICCFLRVFIRIRDRSSKKCGALFDSAAEKIRNCCDAATKSSFPQRVRRLYERATNEELHAPEAISKPIGKFVGFPVFEDDLVSTVAINRAIFGRQN